MNFANVTDIKIPEGNVTKIEETSTGRVLWQKIIASYPPDITPDQKFTLTANYNNYCNIKGDNTTKNKYVTDVSWKASGLPAGITIDADIGQLYGKPTVVGSYTPSITVKTNYGSDTEKVKLDIPVPSAWYPKIKSSQYFYGFHLQAMPEYQILRSDTAPASNEQWSATWQSILCNTVSLKSSSSGTISSSYLGFLAGQPIPGQGEGTITVTTDFGTDKATIVIVVLEETPASTMMTCLSDMFLMGLPAGMNKVGNKGKFEYIYYSVPSKRYTYNNSFSEMGRGFAKKVTSGLKLTGSSNLTISGQYVTVNSAGSCSVTATAPATYTDNGTSTVTTTWTAS